MSTTRQARIGSTLTDRQIPMQAKLAAAWTWRRTHAAAADVATADRLQRQAHA